ncbi:MAG: hypothetical protein CMJ39_07285 [Phycisphaerae bacterium]|nr:hypothetical protein [Phycisphaerae bacterium]
MYEETTIVTDQPRRAGRRFMVLAAVLVASLEVIGAIGLMSIMNPGGAVADDLAVASPEPEQGIVEIPVLAERLQNNQEGFTRVYDVEIYVQVKASHAARIRQELASQGQQCRSEMVHLWRSLDPSHLNEPNLRTASRRLMGQMLERFGRDARTSEPIVRDVIVISGTGFRAD